MQRLPRTLGLVVGVTVCLALASPVWAGERLSSYVNGSLRKLGRGVANALTSVGEPFRVMSLVEQEDGVVASLTIGLVQGAWRTLLRAVAGGYEIATFPIEIPRGFKPVITPEFIISRGRWAK